MPPAVPATTAEAVEQLKSFDPSYKEYNDETAQESIEALTNAADNNINVEKSTSENLSDDSTKNKILQLIKELAIQQSQIDKVFSSVNDKLAEIDSKNISDRKLQPEWIVLRDRYRKLVRESKTKASELSSFSLSFANVLVPSIVSLKDDPDYAKKVTALLDVYINEVDKRKKEAQVISDSFTTLEDDLHSFATSYAEFAKEKSDQIGEEQAKLKIRLIELKGEVEKYGKMIIGFGLAVGISFFAGAVGGVLLLSPLAPIGILVIGLSALVGLGSLGGMIYAIVKKNKAEEEITRINKRLAEIASTLNTIEAVNTTLQTITLEVESVIQSLNGFNKVWDWIVGELVKIKADSERAETFLSIVTAFEYQLKDIQKNWTTLAEVLDAYVANIISTDE